MPVFFTGHLNCTPAQKLLRVSRFLDRQEATGCPNEALWLTLMHAVSPEIAGKVFVNVGAYKGYELLLWLEVWAPHYLARKQLDRTKWKSKMPPGCGFCSQCKGKGSVVSFLDLTNHANKATVVLWTMEGQVRIANGICWSNQVGTRWRYESGWEGRVFWLFFF